MNEANGVVEVVEVEEVVEANVAFRSFKVEAASVKFITATWSLCDCQIRWTADTGLALPMRSLHILVFRP